MDGILSYYREKASTAVAERFFGIFLQFVDQALMKPESFHTISSVLRRANFPGFPYHFPYRQTSLGIRVLVLRHNRRHPSYGLKRQ